MPDIQTLRADRETKLEAFKAAGQAIQDAPDTIAPSQLDALKASFEKAEAEWTKADYAVELFEKTREARRLAIPEKAGAAGSRGPRIENVREELTYRRDTQHETSFFKDVVNQGRDPLASERLAKHQRQASEAYDLSSTDGAGGYLIPPLWLPEVVDYARAGRPVVNAIGVRPLPPNTDVINLPRTATGTAVATQADGGTVQETDATFDTVAADVKTIAGLQDFSRQLLDRSLPGIDEVIGADLIGAYNAAFDTAVINSATSNYLGLLQVSGINALTYTAATPVVSGFWPKLADAIGRIAAGVYRPATHIFVHPRRWAWMLAALDSSNRPLIVPDGQGPQNGMAVQVGVEAEGAVGSVGGVPVFVDANIPTNLGAGTNEDRVIVVSAPELYVWEDPLGPRIERFDDVGSGTLTVRLRAHGYHAQCNARRPLAISVVSGTGLATPVL